MVVGGFGEALGEEALGVLGRDAGELGKATGRRGITMGCEGRGVLGDTRSCRCSGESRGRGVGGGGGWLALGGGVGTAFARLVEAAVRGRNMCSRLSKLPLKASSGGGAGRALEKRDLPFLGGWGESMATVPTPSSRAGLDACLPVVPYLPTVLCVFPAVLLLCPSGASDVALPGRMQGCVAAACVRQGATLLQLWDGFFFWARQNGGWF